MTTPSRKVTIYIYIYIHEVKVLHKTNNMSIIVYFILNCFKFDYWLFEDWLCMHKPLTGIFVV